MLWQLSLWFKDAPVNAVVSMGHTWKNSCVISFSGRAWCVRACVHACVRVRVHMRVRVCACVCGSLLTEGSDDGADDAVGHDDGEHTQGPAVHGSVLKLISLVL